MHNRKDYSTRPYPGHTTADVSATPLNPRHCPIKQAQAHFHAIVSHTQFCVFDGTPQMSSDKYKELKYQKCKKSLILGPNTE